jgi:hypothetical protein
VVAATVAKSQLANGPLTQAAVNHAATAGYATAFQVASAIAFAGFLIALVAVREGRTATAPDSVGVAA